MRILIATPLFPPDIAEPAPYVKELAYRLKETETVTVLTYNHIPEDVPQVSIIAVPKRSLLPVRIVRFIYELIREARKADILYIQNGPSVELPLIVARLFMTIPVIFRLGDVKAIQHAKKHAFREKLLSLSLMAADGVVIHENETFTRHKNAFHLRRPLARLEVLPFRQEPLTDLEAYTDSWQTHVRELEIILRSFIR